MEHDFTPRIQKILQDYFENHARDIFEKSPLLQYLNLKTVSASRGSKARGSFANLYAIYVLVEDYIEGGFHQNGKYSDYEGAMFSKLFKRQRELPFGSRLQNHALNHRMNQEFRRFFAQVDAQPILRVVETKRYWINEKLLICSIGQKRFNLARPVIDIIDAYVGAKRASFSKFIKACKKLKTVSGSNAKEAEKFISGLIEPDVDARIFEIVSYSILKIFYHEQIVYFGFQRNNLEKSPLMLFKTGRTNASDGGIDFVMKPLGRFFQVTESLDVRKYFLDIDKVERYPISFVIKSDEAVKTLLKKLRKGAERQYAITAIVDKYMDCIEEIINLPILKERFCEIQKKGRLPEILEEIIRQSKVEFDYGDNI